MTSRRFRDIAGVAAPVAVAVVGLLVVAVIPAAAHVNHVEADAQVTADGTVVVESTFAATRAWLAVRADAGGQPGEPLGWTRVPAEFITDQPVEIRDDEWDGGGVWVVLHNPDGDGTFEPDEDEPVEAFGEPVQDRFHVERGAADALVVAEGFRPQESDAPTVTVREVRLPADGEVVIRNATGDGPGEPVGRQSLSAGTHRNVTVSIDEGFYRSRPESFALWATIRTADGQVTAGGEPVGTRFGVVRKNPPDATQTGTGGGTPESTPTPVNGADGSTPTAGTTNTSEEPIGIAGPGFGVVAALVALAGTLVLGLRNRT